MCKKHKKKIHLRQICGFHLNPCTLSPLLCVVVVFRHPISDNNVGKNRCTPMSGLWVHPSGPWLNPKSVAFYRFAVKAPRLKLLFVHADAAASLCICVSLGKGSEAGC